MQARSFLMAGVASRVLLLLACIQLAVALAHCSPAAAEEGVFVREEFADLDRWSPLTFPRINRHTEYSAAAVDGRTVLRAASDASASGLVLQDEFDVYEFPVVRWRWRVENVYTRGDGRRKSGDDYPIRVYIIFKFDPDTAGFLERTKYRAAKLRYGEYPPGSTLNYVWASRDHGERTLTSPYTDRAKMVILRHGKEELGQWLDEEIDIISDYREAFGEDPPRTASLAIMNDSDDTGEASVSYVDYIEVRREEGPVTGD